MGETVVASVIIVINELAKMSEQIELVELTGILESEVFLAGHGPDLSCQPPRNTRKNIMTPVRKPNGRRINIINADTFHGFA